MDPLSTTLAPTPPPLLIEFALLNELDLFIAVLFACPFVEQLAIMLLRLSAMFMRLFEVLFSKPSLLLPMFELLTRLALWSIPLLPTLLFMPLFLTPLTLRPTELLLFTEL